MMIPSLTRRKALTVVFILTIISVVHVQCQTLRYSGYGTRVHIISNVKTTKGTNEQPSGGTGLLGILFKKDFFYGSVIFNVFNKNEALTDTTKKPFTNNLLIPDNSGQGVSNFNVSFGFQNLYNEEMSLDTIPLFSTRRIGIYGFWQANNTIWTKDTVAVPVYISSFGLYVTYNILSIPLNKNSDQNINLMWFGGYENRVLGGDYRLQNNKPLRKEFIGTEQLHFKSLPSAGFKLEVGNFYGKITETNFGLGEISGFNSWQATITVGAIIDLDITSSSLRAKHPELRNKKFCERIKGILGRDKKKEG
ncbi:MAG TPA: hypothetical protein VL443_23530 [Cyclobacteriaceae bacterium]|jgi:hypothetical protein|nr:hypothetical protein [Cyclobacteriaceae bacterium]